MLRVSSSFTWDVLRPAPDFDLLLAFPCVRMEFVSPSIMATSHRTFFASLCRLCVFLRWSAPGFDLLPTSPFRTRGVGISSIMARTRSAYFAPLFCVFFTSYFSRPASLDLFFHRLPTSTCYHLRMLRLAIGIVESIADLFLVLLFSFPYI